MGIDTQFSQQKHGYVLSFPWNFPEIIRNVEGAHRPLAKSNFWYNWVFNNQSQIYFNSLFREFHTACAIPDYEIIDKLCEGKLSQYVRESVKRIHFHGLDLELANLTVEQPKMKLLKVEISHGVNVERAQNLPASEYQIKKTTLLGANESVYVQKNDTRSFLDHLDGEYKPYVIAATVLIESPMKLFVQNQNYSKVLFGSNDEEIVKNVVRFETQARWLDIFKLLNVQNKADRVWKITDFNNVLNENPITSQF